MPPSFPLPPRSAYRRYRTPTVIQLEAAECGAAALCIILRYYGRQVSLEEAREACGTSRDGVNALNILRAAQSYDLQAEGYRCELDDLYKAQLPVIAFWNFNHFVVIEGFGKKQVYINDPASGPRSITYEELNHSFTGVILTLAPTEKFQRLSVRSPIWNNLWERLHLFRWPVTFSVLTGLLAIVPTLMLAALSQVFVDEILLERVPNWETGFIIAFILMVVLSTGIHYIQSRATINFSIQLSTLLSSEFIWQLLRLPLLFFSQRFGGEVASRMNLNQSVADTFVGQVLTTFISLVFAFFFALVMLYYDLQITLIGVILVLTNLWILVALYRSRANAYANYRQIQGALASFTLNGLENIESLKAVSGEYQFLSRYGSLYTQSLNATQTMARADLILGTLAPFFSSLGYLAVLLLGAWRIIQGYLTVGEFFALQILFRNFAEPVLNLASLNQTVQLLTINTARLNDVLLHPQDPLLKVGNAPTAAQPPFKGLIAIKNLTFGYNRYEPPLLNAINVTLLPGTFTALVGPSGCGKSTLIKLVGNLLKPWQGEILIDGISAHDYPSSDLAREIAFVEQTPMLIHGSIESNLNWLNPLIPQHDLVQAAQDACIHEEISARPGGYQALVQRQGLNFSGGQRQRLEIACALARQPSLIILDEATSAIDAIREKKILDNIRKRKCACFIITHRLSAIQDCDQILVMDKGKIVQVGNHTQLMEQNGLYRDLVHAEKLRN